MLNRCFLDCLRTLILLTGGLSLTSCGDGDTGASIRDISDTRDKRVHDGRTFKVVLPTYRALSGAALYQGKYAGLQGEAGYVIEVPDNWNGTLVMYAHGYRGSPQVVEEKLKVDPPDFGMRQALIDLGYAWAASSFSANAYDVRAGIEDTNALALAFSQLTEGKYGAPKRYLIMGQSMGGHVAAAAVERETLATVRNKVNYAAALPLCGVMAPEYQFRWLVDYTLVAAQLAGLGPHTYPQTNFEAIWPDIEAALFVTMGMTVQENAAQGAKLREIARHLTGGDRPVFEQSFHNGLWQGAVISAGGADGTIDGILNKNIYENVNTTYRWTSGPEPTPAEAAFNAAILRVKADPAANIARNDGLRWLPRVNGEFDVPVMSMHTIGDFFVPFGNQQKYYLAAHAKGSGDKLVQRAIRAAGHCDFRNKEIKDAFKALEAWQKTGVKPKGDDVMTPEVIAHPNYGCLFTQETRDGVAACPPAS